MDSMDAMDDGTCCPRLSVLFTFTWTGAVGCAAGGTEKRLEAASTLPGDERYGLYLGFPSCHPPKVICVNLRNLRIEKRLPKRPARVPGTPACKPQNCGQSMDAMVFAVVVQLLPRLQSSCGKRSALKKCSRCRPSLYCSRGERPWAWSMAPTPYMTSSAWICRRCWLAA
jgi:hypothetical protein